MENASDFLYNAEIGAALSFDNEAATSLEKAFRLASELGMSESLLANPKNKAFLGSEEKHQQFSHSGILFRTVLIK